jgi:hypothetical protein
MLKGVKGRLWKEEHPRIHPEMLLVNQSRLGNVPVSGTGLL